ncbi:hypothetical protein [Microbulbifer spongiae]|uniref:DUF805 domain-containing protein n=1 Tax=Microbulbifer spongiae TaxID=2944933 RepID=A0ABY9EHB5_9GAMM|nr:hypothetical protein [Microbulbifer sp. MI-G]WKD50241.1 hypothetical protein M8T91_02070 [Microbulbifer sp. MI-G]
MGWAHNNWWRNRNYGWAGRPTQFLMIIFVFIKSLGDNPLRYFVFNNSVLSVPVILVVFVCFSLVLGYLDSKFGFRGEEIRNPSKSNPVLMDIQQSIDGLSAKLGDGVIRK